MPRNRWTVVLLLLAVIGGALHAAPTAAKVDGLRLPVKTATLLMRNARGKPSDGQQQS